MEVEHLEELVRALRAAARGEDRTSGAPDRPVPAELVDAFDAHVSRHAAVLKELSEARAAVELLAEGVLPTGMPATPLGDALRRLCERVRTVADAVIRIARHVGVEGTPGLLIEVPEARGVFEDVMDAMNGLSRILSEQVRDIAQVTLAVARGELRQRMTVDARGELLELKLTINTMLSNLEWLSAEVGRVTREVSHDARRANPVDAPPVSGVWKELTETVSATEHLALASRYKSEFLANMSHELRSPLSSLLVLARVLSENRERHLGPKELEYVRTIHEAGTDLLGLVNDILDMSKVEAGKLQVELEDVPLARILDVTERTFRHVAEEKQLGFRIRAGAGLPALVHTDPLRLQQVLRNLLSNAFKFTERGEVALDVEFRQGAIAFHVRDTGIGIPEEKQQIIFEAFEQADGGTARKYGGTGLGLTISRQLATLLGGQLDAESTPGVGSTFTLTLPVAPGASTATEARRVSMGAAASLVVPRDAPAREQLVVRDHVQATTDLTGARVLVVDDDIRSLFVLSGALEKCGASVLFAQDGVAALAVLASTPDIHAVLMDVVMPRMDGVAAIRLIRAQERYRSLPIIAITGRASRDDRARCLAAGATEHLTRPVELAVLLQVLREHDVGGSPRG
jgi:signal transduction histidine kinase/ActR/RegA family two-component response regulator